MVIMGIKGIIDIMVIMVIMQAVLEVILVCQPGVIMPLKANLFELDTFRIQFSRLNIFNNFDNSPLSDCLFASL